MIHYLDELLQQAIQRGASDLHFEPYAEHYRIRFRIDGILYEVARPPLQQASQIAARLKVMAQLDIAERRMPQDGRLQLSSPQHGSVDFRISTLPTQHGEKIVLRVQQQATAIPGLEQLGLTESQQTLYRQALHQPQGMILVTGPTGSGKTLTLYAGLALLNTSSRNIATAEDPVEMSVPGVNQVAIHVKTGLTFSHALRAFLRQDPDVIMVGEIRDQDTAEIAVKAAQTGHLVLSTLHTNSAAEAVIRLQQMGLAAYNLASSLQFIIAQRLARCLCQACKAPELLPAAELTRQGLNHPDLPPLNLYQAVGCDHCTDGYRGRIGIFEVLPMTPVLRDLILQQASATAIQTYAAEAGFIHLRTAALMHVAAGVMSLAEANRVVGHGITSAAAAGTP